jgi:hypothetical protein
MYAILNLNFLKGINMHLTGSFDLIQQAIKLTGASKSKLADSHDIQSVSGYSDLCHVATKIKHRILEERKCLSGRIKFAILPRRLMLWSLRRNSGIGDLIGEFKQGLKDIYRKLEDTGGTSASLKREIDGFFKSIGESIDDSGLPETASSDMKFGSLDSSTEVNESITCVKSLLYGDSMFQPTADNVSIGQVLEKLEIAKVDSIQNLTSEHLQTCVEQDKPIVVMERGDALLIRKNEEGSLEVTRFTIQPKTLETNGGIQMDSGDYVNAFQLFDLDHGASIENIQAGLLKICNGEVQAKEVPQEKMFLIKSSGITQTSSNLELLQALQYAVKGNPSKEALVARFEIDRYVVHLDNIKSKMATESLYIGTFNALTRDVQQRILSLQASGKISPDVAATYLSSLVTQTVTSQAAGPVAPLKYPVHNMMNTGKAATTYTQDITLQTSEGHNIQVGGSVPTFLQQANINKAARSARLSMGFASAQRFEKLILDHDGTLNALQGQGNDPEKTEETLENITGFFRMAVLFVEYNKRNGIDIPIETQNKLIKLGAAIYKKYGKACNIDQMEYTYQATNFKSPSTSPLYTSEAIKNALFDEGKPIEGFVDAMSLLAPLDNNEREDAKACFTVSPKTLRDKSAAFVLRRKCASNGFTCMIISLNENSKDGVAFSRQNDTSSIVIKNVSFGEQLQNDYKEICGVLNDALQGKIAQSKHAKRFPFLEHCHLPHNGNAAQKTEAMLSWLQTSGNANIFDNLGMQRMFCKLLCGDANNPHALGASLKDKATRERFVHTANQFFETALKDLPDPIKTEEAMQKYKFYASLYMQLNGMIKEAGEPELNSEIFDKQISLTGTVNEELAFACVLCKKMISGEKLTPDEILKCTDPKMMIWPEMAGASDTLLERDPEDSSGIKNMFEGGPLEALRSFIIDQVDALTEDEFQKIGRQYAQQRGYENPQVTVDRTSKLITIKGEDGKTKASIDLNNFVCLIDGTHPEEHVKTKEGNPIFAKLGIDDTNSRYRVKVEGDTSTVDGKIIIDNRTNRATMGNRVLVMPKPLPPGAKPKEIDSMLSHFLPFVEATDTACEEIYFYDPMSLDEPVFMMKDGKLYTSDGTHEYKFAIDAINRKFKDQLLKNLSCEGATKTNVLGSTDHEDKVLSYIMPDVHYNNQVLQFNRGPDGELHLASNEQYVLSDPPIPNPFDTTRNLNYICLRSKDNPSDYKFILVNNENLIDSSSLDNVIRQKAPILSQDVFEIGFNSATGFELSSSNYQATGIMLVGKLFEAGNNKGALDILNKINMREVVAGKNGALLSLVFRPLVTDASKGNVLKLEGNLAYAGLEEKLATFKIITLLLEADPYNFRNLLLARNENGTVNFEKSFELIMQMSSLYQSLVDARENSTMEVNLSKENELVIVEEIIGAMNQALQAAPLEMKVLMPFISEKKMLELIPEYGSLKLFEQRHQILVEELGIQSSEKHFTKVAKDSKDHEIVHCQPGGKRSFAKASKFASALPTRNTEMLAKLRQEARKTALLQTPSNIERRKNFLQKCCRSDEAIRGDSNLTPQQQTDYIAFRKAMDFPQFSDGENDVIIGSIEKVFISEIEGFLNSQSTKVNRSEALDGEKRVRALIMESVLKPVRAPQTSTPPSAERADDQQNQQGADAYKINLLLEVIQWDEKAIQSHEALTQNDKQLILAFKKKYGSDIHSETFRGRHESELLDLANAISGQRGSFSSNGRQGIAQYESTAQQELNRYNEEMSLAGSQDLRARALEELYEINAESLQKPEGGGKSPIESTIDDIAAQIETATKEMGSIQAKLEEKFANCSKTMASLRQTKLAKTPTLNDARKALVCAPSDLNGDWSKSIKVLQDINPEFTIADCKEIVNLTRQLLQASTAIKFMEQLKAAVENVRDKGQILLDNGQAIPSHGATNLTPEQKNFLLAKDQLITAYENIRTYNPEDDMEALVFEDIVGFRVRGAQANIVRNVTAQLQTNEADDELTGVTFQLMMGGGKTSVILSQVAHSISLQHKIPLFVCHPSQYTAMVGNLRLFQESRYSQEVISIDESKSDLQDRNKLSGIARKLKRAKDGGGCLVIQAPTLRAIKLEFIRTSRLAMENGDPAVMARAKQLAGILSEVKENCVQLLDEIDLNLDISKSVNFPSGARKALATTQIETIASMLDVITEDSELYGAFCGDKFGVERGGQTPVLKFKEKIIDRCFGPIQALDDSITKDDFQKFMLGTGEPSANFKKSWEKIKKDHQKDAEKIALQKGMLSIADSAAKKEYNRHYGFREDGSVIPYQGVGTPSSGEFGNVYEQAYYFFAAVLHNGIQLSQMTSLVDQYVKGSLPKSLVSQLESAWSDAGLGKLSDLKKMSDTQLHATIHKATQGLNSHKQSANFMLFAKMLAANTINYNSELLECDAVSMVDMSKTSVGCTGTPWNMQTYHSAFQGDNKAILELGTEGKIMQKWRKDFQTRASKILTPAAANVSSILGAHKIAHPANSGNLRALVDAGGIFKDRTNEEVANDILNYYKDDPSVRYVVYLGKTITGEESFFVMDKNDRGHPHPIPNTSLEEIEKVVGKGKIGETFTYFDELRCTGCDVPLDKNARAILTVNPDTTPIRTALQGILRARKFLDSQTVDLCVPQGLIPPGVSSEHIESNPEEAMTKICSHCIENQSVMLAKQTYKSYRAQMSNCLKSILFERLHEIISKHDGKKISKQERKILELCKKFIYSSFEPNPLELFGGFTSEQKAYEALQNYYEGMLADIEKLDGSIAKEFKARAEKILTQAREVLNFTIQAGVVDTGTEVEAEQEQEKEQEQEAEQEQVAEDGGKVMEETSWNVLKAQASTDAPAPASASDVPAADQPAESSQPADVSQQAPTSTNAPAPASASDVPVAQTDGDAPASQAPTSTNAPAADQTVESSQPTGAAPQAPASTDASAAASASDVSAAAQPAESSQPADVSQQATKSLEDRAASMMEDFYSEEKLDNILTVNDILENFEDKMKSPEDNIKVAAEPLDLRLQAAARKNELSDRELLAILNERYNNEDEVRLLSELDGPLLEKTKTRILDGAPAFASLISREGAATPRILSANECIASKSDSPPHIFGENVQITANLARNVEGVDWMDDSQRKDAQFVLVYKSDGGTFKTLLLSDQDAQEIGKAMADLNVKDCWMFNAAGIPTSTNPLATIEPDVLAAGRTAAANLSILYGNFHHLNSTEDNQTALRTHADTPEARENFLKRVQTLHPREYDEAVQFFSSQAA